MAGFQLSINGRFWVSTEGLLGGFISPPLPSVLIPTSVQQGSLYRWKEERECVWELWESAFCALFQGPCGRVLCVHRSGSFHTPAGRVRTVSRSTGSATSTGAPSRLQRAQCLAKTCAPSTSVRGAHPVGSRAISASTRAMPHHGRSRPKGALLDE